MIWCRRDPFTSATPVGCLRRHQSWSVRRRGSACCPSWFTTIARRSFPAVTSLGRTGAAQSGDGGILGREQTQWLIDGLNASTAVWKVVANDLPISIVVGDKASNPPDGPAAMEAVAQGENGRPLGREIAFSRILSATKDVRNIVYLTADVHYTAAISYHPERAAFDDFAPFWGFVSGLLNAGAFPQSPLDGTFGAQYEFVHAPTEENTSPAEGFQHFGEVAIDSDSRVLTVDLRDASGKSLFSKSLPTT